MEKRLVRMNGSGLARPKLPECQYLYVALASTTVCIVSPFRVLPSVRCAGLHQRRGIVVAFDLQSTGDRPFAAEATRLSNFLNQSDGTESWLTDFHKETTASICLAQLLDRKAEAQEHLIQARAAIEHCPKHLRPRFYDWMDCIDLQISG
jgi:hypothetical protein